MEKNGETHQFDKIIVYQNGKRLEIEPETMTQILYYIDNTTLYLNKSNNSYTK